MKKWLLVPGVVFVVIFIALLLALPKPEKISTVVSATPTSGIVTNVVPVGKSTYQNLYNQISGYTPEDPSLSAPNFDRKISLPAE